MRLSDNEQLHWFAVRKGEIVVLVLWEGTFSPLVKKIFLGLTLEKLLLQAGKDFPNMRPAISPELRTFQNCLEKYLKGQPVTFPLELLSLQQCSLFQQSVYQVTAAIPWGQVATYKEIAGRLGKPGASQAVGQALARNHFPLVIPCHRVVKSDGQTGGFSSGLQVKKILLRLEGWK